MFPSLRRFVEIAGTVCGLVGLVIVGFLSGMDLLAVSIDRLSVQFVFFKAALTVIGFTTVATVTGTFLVWNVWNGGDRPDVTSGPEARAIVPAYRDAESVDVSVWSLLDSEYESLTIAIVVEPDDEPTRERARELAVRHEAVDCLVNDEPGSKATAINSAVRRSDAEYFAVFDADERVSPAFVPAAMGELLDGADVFQGRRIPRPTGAVETLAYCERIVVQTGYACGELFGFTHCQSSSTVFTRDAFEAVGGYDDKLTEDIDFSHKCYRADLSVTRSRGRANTMEAPHTLRDLWGQRKRWRIGHVQVFHYRIREALDGEFGFDGVLSVGRAAGALVGGASLLVIASHVLLLLLRDVESAFLVPYASVLALIGAVWLKDAVDGRVGSPSWSVLFVPLVYLGHGVLTVKAVLEYYLTWDDEWYQVTKTGT